VDDDFAGYDSVGRSGQGRRCQKNANRGCLCGYWAAALRLPV